jgi:hypothetical protein
MIALNYKLILKCIAFQTHPICEFEILAESNQS